ncbi:hypothetical protein CC2G_011182 [Coprinopsis cinerea AmutBmut pab1-1]|nr:hypothetical protein CC2G_011182 [Coprinopsis cinerea AmutBmut pab1-1]
MPSRSRTLQVGSPGSLVLALTALLLRQDRDVIKVYAPPWAHLSHPGVPHPSSNNTRYLIRDITCPKAGQSNAYATRIIKGSSRQDCSASRQQRPFVDDSQTIAIAPVGIVLRLMVGGCGSRTLVKLEMQAFLNHVSTDSHNRSTTV